MGKHELYFIVDDVHGFIERMKQQGSLQRGSPGALGASDPGHAAGRRASWGLRAAPPSARNSNKDIELGTHSFQWSPSLATSVLAGVVVVGVLGCGSDTGTSWVVFDAAGNQLDAEHQEHNTDSNVEADLSGGEGGSLAERDAEPGVEVLSPQHFLPNNLIPGYSPCVQFDAASPRESNVLALQMPTARSFVTRSLVHSTIRLL